MANKCCFHNCLYLCNCSIETIQYLVYFVLIRSQRGCSRFRCLSFLSVAGHGLTHRNATAAYVIESHFNSGCSFIIRELILRYCHFFSVAARPDSYFPQICTALSNSKPRCELRARYNCKRLIHG